MCFVLVLFGWVFFRLESIEKAFGYCAVMVGLGSKSGFHYFDMAYYLNPGTVLYLILAFFFAFCRFHGLADALRQREWGAWLQGAGALALILLASVSLSVSGFNPFIYFRF